MNKYITRRGQGPECGICFQYANKSATNVRNHIESKHFPGMISYQCDWCRKVFSTKQSMDKHRIRCNNNAENRDHC